MLDADECDVENQQAAAESSGPDHADAPSLPPRPVAPVAADDVWVEVEPEPSHPYHHVDTTNAHAPIFLLPTMVARILATIGWVGAVVTSTLLLVALFPSFEDGDSRNFVLELDAEPWYAATLIVSTAVIYLGWLWWSLSASFNARRLAPLATSPWLPTMVYLVGPLIVLIGLDADESYRSLVVFGGCAWIAIGHLVVVASMRSTAGRIGASMDEFSKLLWLPLAGVAYRMLTITLLTFVDDAWQKPGLLLAFGALGVLFPVGMVAATWRATESFDHACHRVNTRSLGLELPTADMVTAAIRQRALEGR